MEALQIQEKRKLLKNDPSSIKSAVKAIKKDTLDDAFLKEAKKGRIRLTTMKSSHRLHLDMDADEAEFSVQAELENQVYKWADKYKPRKPRFFNRVHTGYEWNKYNQTHYDFDNPPPKIVQGYKINVFYPDLIDKSISPDFKLSTLKG